MTDTANTLNHSITEAALRGIAVGLSDGEYNASHHRTYVRMDHPKVNDTNHTTSWNGPLCKTDYLAYFCPGGWRRFAVKVPTSLPAGFWENSSNMYHGLKPQNVKSIVGGGFVPSECQHDGKAVYLTPSIRYAAHPRYARVQLYKGLYYQVVLQCRVLNSQLTAWKDAVLKGGVSHEDACESGDAPSGETLGVKESMTIDDNQDNKLMEFLWFANKTVTAKDGLVVTGVMVRCLSTNPIDLEENRWWQEWQGKDTLMTGYVNRC